MSHSILPEKMSRSLAYVLLATISTSLGRGTEEKCKCLKNAIDIGFGIDEHSLPIPTFAPFRYTKRAIGHWGGGNGPLYYYNEFSTSEYVGTSMAAASYAVKGATTVGNLPLNKLITKAILVDVSQEVGDNWNYCLPASKLDEWVATNGELPNNCFLIIKFGWSSRYPNRTQYLGPSDDDLRYPGLSIEAMEWIVNSEKVTGVGYDIPTATPGSQVLTTNLDQVFMIFRNNMYGVDNLNLAADLPPRFDVIILPMKLTDGPGAPTRVIAFV